MNSAAREQARQMAHKSMDYRRALSACLQARGYSVR
jgi:hypothetical protein